MLRRAVLLLLCLSLTGTALASQEQIHRWKTANVIAPTDLFGDVEVKAGADATGNVDALTVVVKGAAITVPAAWLSSLPRAPLASLEVRTERGYDPQPLLYVVLRTGPRTQKDAVELHITFQGGKLLRAYVTTYDGKGGSKQVERKAP